MTWQTVPLGELYVRRGTVSPRSGSSYSLYSVPSYETGAPEFLDGDGIGSAKQRVRPGDVLLCRIVPHIRRAWVVSDHEAETIASTEWIVLAHPAVDSGYLRHFLLSDPFHAEFMSTLAGVGGSLSRARPTAAARIPVPLPPLPEQRRIAAILDEADALRSTWGETRESARRAISSRISALLSKSTDVKPLAQLLAEPMRNGISPSRGGRYEGEVLTLSAITRGAFDPRQRKSDLFAAPHAADKLAIEGLHLICRGNGNAELVGAMVAVTDQLDGVAFPDTMIGFRPSSEINSPTLVAAWRHPTVRDQLRRAARTTNGTYKVNQQSLASVTVPVPRREDQEQIAALDAERAKLDSQLAQGLVSLDELFASLQHRAFRGEL